MSNRSSSGRRWLAVAAIVLGVSSLAMAAEDTSGSYSDGALRKLGRGIANVLTGPGELIRMPELVGRRDGYFAALTVGLVQGAWRTALRELAGAFEITTFYWEMPKKFGPLVTPEFVWKHGDWAE